MANKQASAMLIPSQCINSVLTSSECFRQLNGSSLVFAFIGPYLMSDDTFSATLTTQAFELRRLRWFAISSCKPIARGQFIILINLSHLLSRLLRHTYTRHPERRLVCSTICITAAFVSAGTRYKSSNFKSFFPAPNSPP
jgi:hypothetical protein